eukprot:9017880-Pyramimonas_sp.AAC.1
MEEGRVSGSSKGGGREEGDEGVHRGLSLVACYAPCSGPRYARARDRFYEEVSHVEGRTRGADNVLILGGDFNAELGPCRDPEESMVLGPHGAPRRSDTGTELLEFCKEEGLFALSTAYPQREACTWWHP